MNKFILTAESGCDLSKIECDKRDIIPISNKYAIDGVTYYDKMTVADCKEFYNKMREGAAPSTSQINPAEYTDFWKQLADKGLPIVHITLGAEISGSYNNAVSAAQLIREELPDLNVTVIDSASASLGYGMIVLKAAELRDKELSAEECREYIDKNKYIYNAWYTTNELKYLYRGGRVSKTSSVVGSVLGINPILNLDHPGCLKVFDKARGEKATLRRMINIVKERAVNPEECTLYISHADAVERAQIFADEIMSEIKFKDVFYSFIGPTIGTHTGPGLVSVFFTGKERD